jgi:hypothetical protein
LTTEHRSGSLHEFLKLRFGLELRRAESLITSVLPLGDDARLLQMSQSQPLLRVKSINLDVNSRTPVEYALARWRADRVQLRIAPCLEPAEDLGKVVITGSHTNSIAALKEGRVDAAAASFNAWEKSVKKGIIDPSTFKVLAKSQPIPNPPLAMSKDLAPELKSKLREAFNNVHKYVSKGQLRGYGGKAVDRYDADYPLDKMLAALDALKQLTKERKVALIDKAGQR